MQDYADYVCSVIWVRPVGNAIVMRLCSGSLKPLSYVSYLFP